MPKRAATDWKVVVGSTQLSSWAFDVQITDEKEQIDVSGFSATGAKEFVPGSADQTIEVTFRNDFGAGGPYATIYPLYQGGSVFKLWVQGDSTDATAATNPWYGGSASCYAFPVSATLNEVEEITVPFRPASNSSFTWSTSTAGP